MLTWRGVEHLTARGGGLGHAPQLLFFYMSGLIVRYSGGTCSLLRLGFIWVWRFGGGGGGGGGRIAYYFIYTLHYIPSSPSNFKNWRSLNVVLLEILIL